MTICGSLAGALLLLSRLGSAVARRRKRSFMLKPSLAEVSMNMMSCSFARASISAELTTRSLAKSVLLPTCRWGAASHGQVVACGEDRWPREAKGSPAR